MMCAPDKSNEKESGGKMADDDVIFERQSFYSQLTKTLDRRKQKSLCKELLIHVERVANMRIQMLT